MSNQQNKNTLPPQHQNQQPGLQSDMKPQPKSVIETYKPAGKLKNKVAIITGGDSGIGRAVAVHYAKEGANIVISYLNEDNDATETKKLVEQEGQSCLTLSGDIGDAQHCMKIVNQTIEKFGQLDILVNNAAEQHPQDSIENITTEQLERTFKTNIFSFFHMTKAALPHLQSGSTIINTASVTAYKGNKQLLDYSSTKGAIVTFTRSLALQLADKGIRVNGVAPGPIWTPLIPSTFSSEQVATFGSTTPLKRPGEPGEVATSYVFLASEDSSYITGQVFHVNGGEIING